MSTELKSNDSIPAFDALSERPAPRIPKISRKADGFNRADVVNAFVSAFEIIGGVNRLALWANANPDKFFPLYAKLLPATTQVIGDMGELVIVHRIAPTALDEHPDQNTFENEPATCHELNSATSQEAISPPSTSETSDGAFSSPIVELERR